MADKFGKETRSRIMRSIRGKDTKPERILRSTLWRRGLRFRNHRVDLPGKPDAAFAGAKVALFADGDFWHGRAWFREGKAPKTNRAFWIAKFERNRARDERVDAELREMGWLSVRVWESDIMRNIGMVTDAVFAIIVARASNRQGRKDDLGA